MIKVPRSLAFAGAAILLASVVDWFLTAESSPAYGFLLDHVAVSNAWGLTNLPPFLAAALVSGNVHAPPVWLYVSVFLVQWGLVGLCVGSVGQRLRRAAHPK